MKSSTNRGLTLIEIMIVLAIIGLLAALAIPAFQKTAEHTRLNRAISSDANNSTNVGPIKIDDYAYLFMDDTTNAMPLTQAFMKERPNYRLAGIITPNTTGHLLVDANCWGNGRTRTIPDLSGIVRSNRTYFLVIITER